MTIAQLQRLQQSAPDEPLALPSPATPGGDKFSNALKNAVERVDGAQKAADGQIEAFVAGEQENLHEVVIAMNEAKLSFQLMTQVRNRLLETYQELMRMQV
ncbi:MAG: flagellar hook-basal body complex protein FliE [Rhodothermales bacterium]